jgi:Ca2+-binding RTX toxin-like protein
MHGTVGRRRIAPMVAVLAVTGLLATMASPAMAAGGCTSRISGTTSLIVHAGEVVCGGSGNDHVDSIEAGGTFEGGAGADSVFQSYGTFNGDSGDDDVLSLYGGTFDGGPGDDVAEYVAAGAAFDGKSGNDSTWTLDGGTFDGGPGNDSVVTNNGGTFTQ